MLTQFSCVWLVYLPYPSTGTVISFTLKDDMFHAFTLSRQSAQRQRQRADKCDYTCKEYFHAGSKQ